MRCALRGGLPSLLLFLGALLLGLLQAMPVAAQTNEHLDLMSFYRTDLRALAMGNAFGPIARGENALLYNPAGLVQYDFAIKADLTAAAEGEEGDFFSDTVDQFTGSPSPQDIQNYLTKYLGTTNLYRYQTFGNAVANLAQFNIGVGAGVLSQTRYAFGFRDTVLNGTFDPGDELVLDKQALDLTVLSFGFGLFDGQLLLGTTLKDFSYEVASGTDTFQNVILNGDIDLATIGVTYDASGYDLGMIWRFETFSLLRAQWSLTANNVGGITLQNAAGPTLEVPATYDVGFSLNPELPWSPVHLILAVEFEDVSGEILVRDPITLTDNERSSQQRMHAGAELGFWETSTGNHILNVRVGNHRGQATAGFELNIFSGMRIVYTTYKDDFGYDGNPDQHTFQAAQITFGFGI